MSLQSFRLSIRFILPLALALGLFAYAVVPLVDDMTLRWFVRDLDTRGANGDRRAAGAAAGICAAAGKTRMANCWTVRCSKDRLYALAFCDPRGAHGRTRPPRYPDMRCGCPASNDAKSCAVADQLPTGRCTSPKARLRRRRAVPGQADPGARHELHRAPQRRYQEIRASACSRAGRGDFADHGVHRPSELARLDQRDEGGCCAANAAALARRAKRRRPKLRPLVGDLRALLHEYNVERRSAGRVAAAMEPGQAARAAA